MCIGKIRNAYKIFIGKSRGLPRFKCVGNKGFYAGRTKLENVVNFNSPAENGNHWKDIVRGKLKFPVPKTTNSFLTKLVTTQYLITLVQEIVIKLQIHFI